MSVWPVRQLTILIIRVTKSLDLNRFASDLDSKKLIRKYRKSNTCLRFWMTAGCIFPSGYLNDASMSGAKCLTVVVAATFVAVGRRLLLNGRKGSIVADASLSQPEIKVFS
jgi:hypothetical protein